MATEQVSNNLTSSSPFAHSEQPSLYDLRHEGPVRYLVVHGRQDDGPGAR